MIEIFLVALTVKSFSEFESLLNKFNYFSVLYETGKELKIVYVQLKSFALLSL